MAILGALGAVLFIAAAGWLIYSIVKHKPKKAALITMAAGLILFIVSAVATPTPLDSKLSDLVEAETNVRQNLMSKDYDRQLFASDYSKLKKKYKAATGESLPSGPAYYLEQSAIRGEGKVKVTSGALYVGAFKYMNTEAAKKVTPDKADDAVKDMHEQYLEK